MTAVNAARGALVVAYVAFVVGIPLAPVGPQLLWTVAIAALPLFWVLGGFHLWRRICPLSWFSQLPRLLGRPGNKKVSGWWSRNALLVQLSVMAVALTLRLLWINGDPLALSGALGAFALIAIGFGAVFRGKTWCNFACPVGMVEKLYVEPSRLVGSANSQCPSCSACKAQCPDIDLEHSYWKGSADRNRRIAYFAWPGLVVGFYLHYYLQAGTWDWYFSGDWTREADVGAKVLSAGFFFADVPRLAAAPLTLLACGAASYGLFSAGHSTALRRAGPTPDDVTVARLRHRAYALAGWVGFNLFYAWAGQPTLRDLPPSVRWSVATAVVAISTLIFARRWNRDEASFVQDRFARKLARRWKWEDDAAGRTSTELVVLHTERTRQRTERLASYRDSVAELAAEGILTREGLAVLGTIRATLGITDAEHDKVVRELTSEGKNVFATADASPEGALQTQQYRQELERLVDLAADAGAAVDERAIARLRRRYSVSDDEHRALLSALLDPGGALAGRLVEQAGRLVSLGAIAQAAAATDRPEADRAFAEYACHEAGAAPSDTLTGTLSVVSEEADATALTDATSPVERAAAAQALLRGPLASTPPEPPAEPLAAAVADSDPWVARAATLLHAPEEADDQTRRLVALHQVALFAGLSPPDLQRLAELAELRRFDTDQHLCTQGEAGDEVFVLLSGQTRVLVAGTEVNTCGPGACIGELAVLAPAPRSATVQASEPTDTLVLSGTLFRELLREQPLLVEGVLEQVARRLQRAGG